MKYIQSWQITRRKLKFIKYVGITQDRKVTTQGNSHILLEDEQALGCLLTNNELSEDWSLAYGQL